jgi:hypothetical protein
MGLLYRVYKPETPRDLPLGHVQEWDSEIVLTVGAEWTKDGEQWRIAAVEPETDPAFAGRVYFELAEPPL